MVEVNNNDGSVRYTTKEMFTQIITRLDTLSEIVSRQHNEFERRIQAIEARGVLNDELARHVAQISTDFTGFERRFAAAESLFALHAQLPYHSEGGVRLKAAEARVEKIEQNEVTSAAVAGVMKEMVTQNRQMTMFFVSQLIVITGLGLTALRVWFGTA